MDNFVSALRGARSVSLLLPVPCWTGTAILLFANNDPGADSTAFRFALMALVIAPAVFNALILLALAILNTNDSAAEARMVLFSATVCLVPSAAVLPKEYWLVWVLAGLTVVTHIVVKLRMKTLNPEGKMISLVKAATPVPSDVSDDRDDDAAYSGFTYEAGRAEHTLEDLAGMQGIKEDLLAAAKEARQILRKDKKGGLRGNARNGILLHGDPGNGKTVFAEGVAGSLKLPIIKMSFGSVGSKWVNSTTENIVALFKDARAQAPCVLFMDEVDSVILDRNSAGTTSEEGPKITNQILTELVNTRGTGVVIIMATNFVDRLDRAAVREGRIDFKIQVPAPDAAARRALIRKALSSSDGRMECEASAVDQTVKRWEGFSVARIRAVVDEAVRQATKRKARSLVYPDLQSALRTMQGGLGERLSEDTPTLDQLHMPEGQKSALMGVAKRMLSIEEIERMGGSVPSGLLLAGPPGTGKTLAVRALAKMTEWPLLTRSGTDLMADGKNIDELIAKAKNARPCIVFIDEADDVFSDRRAGSTYSASITNKLMTAMDGVGGKVHDILWIAAVNAPETMDAAALRGGRFTEKVWFENPDVQTIAGIVGQWMVKSSAKFEAMLTPAAVAAWLEGESPANIQAILQQAVNIMIGRALGNSSSQIVIQADLAKARIAVLGEAARTGNLGTCSLQGMWYR
ncbi:MAG: AAA family ATPase [Sulfuritalea sp.]|nr:AAA family ATPase [Sulfuritalea sp.]